MNVKRYHPGMEIPKQDNIEWSLKLAREKLAKVDINQAADKLGFDIVEVEGKPGASLEFMDSPVTVSWPEGVAYYPDGSELPGFFNAFVLHYLVSPGGVLDGELITYVQCPAGKVYEGPFNKMTRDVLLATFGENIDLFNRVIGELGWEKGDMGDASAVVYPYPRVPMTFVLYAADDEFGPDAQVFFDKNVTNFLPEEDLKLTCGMMIGKAKKLAAKLTGDSK